VDAIIIAGGLGTRLYPLTLRCPKAAIPFLDVPIICYQLKLALDAGCRRVIVAGGHQFEKLKETLTLAEDYLRQVFPELSQIEIHLLTEEEPLGTGGAVANAIRVAGVSAPAFVMNGDILSDVDARELWKCYESSGGKSVILAPSVSDARHYGSLLIESFGAEDRIVRFTEKGETDGKPPYPINGGAYILGSDAINAIASRDGEFSLERQIFPELAKEGKLVAKKHQGFWRDVGTLESFMKTQLDVLGVWLTEGREKFFGMRDDFALFRDFIYIHNSVALGKSCDLFHRVVLMRKCKVGSGSRLQNAVALPGAVVEENCQLTSVLIDADTLVPSGTILSQSVISRGKIEPLTL